MSVPRTSNRKFLRWHLFLHFKSIGVFAFGAALELIHCMGPLGEDASERDPIISVAADLPHVHGINLFLQCQVVAVHHLGPHIDPAELVGIHALQLSQNVFDLPLNGINDRAGIAVWTVKHAQVREAGGSNTGISQGTLAPGVSPVALGFLLTRHLENIQLYVYF